MTKVSPIAQYLTANKALVKRQNNVWHFYTGEGMCIGRQEKLEKNGATAYIREIYGEGLKKLYYECKVIGQRCLYYKEDKSPIGISILPDYIYLLTYFIDYIKNKMRSVQIERKLKSPIELIAVEPNVNVGIYDIKKPFVYEEKTLLDKTEDLKKSLRVQHTFN